MMKPIHNPITTPDSKPIFDTRVDIVGDYSKYLADKIDSNIGQFVVTINPEIVMQTRNDSEFQKIINSADLIIPDGVGITLHFLLRRQKVTKHAGIEVTYKLLELLNQTDNNKITIVGSNKDTISKAKTNLSLEFPNLTITEFDGYFDNIAEKQIQNHLESNKPNLILVGLGSPKQEKWIHSNLHRYCPNSIWIGVGGSFDIWSGSKKRAPNLMISLGFEWLHRLIQEPWRAKRMLILPWFLVVSVWELVFEK
jgi:N-acetylglucosaminyldiphosphoundecaprenol N-acetyl-beta-D-mannosaminyltransferase